MRVLIAGEENGKTRDAFKRRGHDAWSCDLLQTRAEGQHLRMDMVKAIREEGPWDIIILHPDCTYLTVAGNRHYGTGKDRHFLRLTAIEWTIGVWNLAKKYARVGAALENPVGVLPKSRMGKPTYIHPWQFGHPEQKKTCLWLDRFEPLKETNNVYEYMMTLPVKERCRIHQMPPGPDRSRLRSETYAGWSEALAEQFGGLNEVHL